MLPRSAIVPSLSFDLREAKVDIPLANPGANGCQKIKRASWRDEVAPGAYFAETNFYCSTSAGLYKIALSNWDGDRAQSKLRLIALQVAQSLRTQ